MILTAKHPRFTVQGSLSKVPLSNIPRKWVLWAFYSGHSPAFLDPGAPEEQAEAILIVITCLREATLLPCSPHRFHSRESHHDAVTAHGLLAAPEQPATWQSCEPGFSWDETVVVDSV